MSGFLGPVGGGAWEAGNQQVYPGSNCYSKQLLQRIWMHIKQPLLLLKQRGLLRFSDMCRVSNMLSNPSTPPHHTKTDACTKIIFGAPRPTSAIRDTMVSPGLASLWPQAIPSQAAHESHDQILSPPPRLVQTSARDLCHWRTMFQRMFQEKTAVKYTKQ